MKHSPRRLAEIAAALDLEFNDISLLEQAFVHGSFVAEFPGVFDESNQRLEFLGDAVLGWSSPRSCLPGSRSGQRVG